MIAGVDVATSAVRVRIVDAEGQTIARGGAQLPPPERGLDGASEQDARTWAPAVMAALREATSAMDDGGAGVRAVAIASTSGTIVPVDRKGESTGPALMYDDRRATRQAQVAQEAGAQRWHELGLSISPSFSLAKLGWLAGAGALEGAHRVCHTADLVAWHLSGQPVRTDWSHALKTGYDPRAGEWAHEALDALAVPADLLPDVGRPTGWCAAVGRDAAEQTGLPEGCEIRLGMTDGSAGQLACGAVEPGAFVSVLGTTLVLKGVTEQLVRDPAGAVYSHRHPDGHWLPGGASNTGGEALADHSDERLRELDDAAAERGPAGVVAYPLRREGERFPFLSADARGFTEGDPADEVEAHRASLEGVAFLERLAYERMDQIGAPADGAIRIAGGGARSDVWSAIRATVLDRPLERPRDADTAFGAALLAAAGTVHPDLAAAAAAMSHTGQTVEPVAAERDRLHDNYGRLVAALDERGWLPENATTQSNDNEGGPTCSRVA